MAHKENICLERLPELLPHSYVLWFLAVLHNLFLVSLNLGNPFINLSSIILLSVHMFPAGNLTDAFTSSPPTEDKATLEKEACSRTAQLKGKHLNEGMFLQDSKSLNTTYSFQVPDRDITALKLQLGSQVEDGKVRTQPNELSLQSLLEQNFIKYLLFISIKLAAQEIQGLKAYIPSGKLDCRIKTYRGWAEKVILGHLC